MPDQKPEDTAHNISDVWRSIADVKERTTRVEGRLDSVDDRLGKIEHTTDNIDTKLDRLAAAHVRDVVETRTKIGDYAPLISLGALCLAGVVALGSTIGFFIFREMDHNVLDATGRRVEVDDQLHDIDDRVISYSEWKGGVTNELQNIRSLIVSIEERIHDHQSNGHPFTVLAKIEALSAAFEENKAAQRTEREDLKARTNDRFTTVDRKFEALLEAMKKGE